MMTRREHRIKWIGFDDLPFMLIGIPLLAVVAASLSANPAIAYTLEDYGFNYLISLSFCILNWLGFRSLTIWSRKKYPNFKNYRKRILIMAAVSLAFFLLANGTWTVILYGVFSAERLAQASLKGEASLAAPLVLSVMMVAIYEVIYNAVGLQKSEKLIEKNKVEMIQTQLNSLKNQNKPHFFFNSLNLSLIHIPSPRDA